MKRKSSITLGLIIALSLIWVAGANAQLTVLNTNVPPGFAQAGIIQEATLNSALANSGGTLTINGIKMIVPDNSIIQLPATSLTWAQLFNPAFSAGVYDPSTGGVAAVNHPAGMTGLALADNSPVFPPVAGTFAGPYPCFNAIVQGNIDVKNSLGFGVGAYIVGLILPINQDLGSLGQGFITSIDYTKGRIEVNGTLNVAGTGTIIEINDPVGRAGKQHSPDQRFTIDTENPTYTSGNGFPMGIPRVAPPAIDPDCPTYNRPVNNAVGAPGHDPFIQPGAPLQAFSMPAKNAPNAAGVVTPDPWKMAPFMVGDYISWAGTLVKFDPTAAIVPSSTTPLRNQVYVSANTISSDKLEITTAPGTVGPIGTGGSVGPCYMMVFKTKLGTGGNLNGINVPANLPIGIVGGNIPTPELQLVIFVRGFVTDSSKLVDIFAVDVPFGGVPTPRLLGTLLPEVGFAGGKGNKGRFRFDIGKGNFLPATRDFLVRSRHGQLQLPNPAYQPPVAPAGFTAPLKGLLSGQFQLPNFVFQFTDAPPGFPNIPNNLQSFPFLFGGEGATPPITPFPPFLP